MTKENISDDEVDLRYRQMIDDFVDHANQLTEQDNAENVGLAMLFAAARFNAYVVSRHADSLEAYESDRPKARHFFLDQYQEMLDQNLEEYKAVYDKYARFRKQ